MELVCLGLATAQPNPFPSAIGAFRAMLDRAGIHYLYRESPGAAHEWLTWRGDLDEFAPRLFRWPGGGSAARVSPPALAWFLVF